MGLMGLMGPMMLPGCNNSLILIGPIGPIGLIVSLPPYWLFLGIAVAQPGLGHLFADAAGFHKVILQSF